MKSWILPILLLLAVGAAQAVPLPAGSAADRLGHAWSAPGTYGSVEDQGSAPQGEDAVAAQTADSASNYNIAFHCAPPPQAPQAGAAADARCPSYVVDVEDIMAQPVLMVLPKDPTVMAFNALHGGHGVRNPGQAPFPTNHSRDNVLHQPHTTFQTHDGGSNWDDNRYYAHIQDKAEVFGEDNAAVLDKQGRMYISSLYSYRENGKTTCVVAAVGCTTTTGPVRFTMLNWKADSINQPFASDVNYVEVTPRLNDSAIEKDFLVYEKDSAQVAGFWFERHAADGLGVIEAVHTPTAGGSVWTRVAQDQAISGCSDMTNPVAIMSQVYVGCFASKAHNLPQGSANLTLGALYIYAFDTHTWNRTFVGPAPFSAPGNALLASAEGLHRGALVAAGAGIDREGKPFVKVAQSDRGLRWTRPSDYYAKTTDTVTHQGAELVEERINALAFVPRDGTIHFIVMERFAASQGGPLQDVGTTPFSKAYVVVQATGKFLGKFNFDYGDPQARASFQPNYQGLGDEVFNDQHDSIVVVSGRSGDRIFLAFGDHGIVRFAEAREENQPPPLFPFGAPIPPIPAAIPAANPAAVGAVAGVLSTAMLAALAAARNKKTTEATA